MKRVDSKQIFLMISSLFLAVFIWATVMDQKNPEKEYAFSNISVKLQEGDLGPRSAGLTVLKGQNQTITVRVKGMRNDIAAIDESRITATVDISDIIVAGNYNLPVEVSLNHLGITLVDVQPTHLNLTVDKMLSRTIPITIRSEGEVNRAFVLGTIACSPDSVTVTGPKSEVDMIKTAEISLKMSDVKKDYTEKQKILLLGADGAEVKTQYTVKNVENVDVFVSVHPIKNVPISVVDTGKLPDNLEFDGYTITPETVDVVGDANSLIAVTSAVTEPIDLSTVTGPTVRTVKLILPEGVKTADEAFTCQVAVRVREREERTVSIHRYEVANVAPGNTVQYDPLEMEITLLATPENFALVDVDQIIAVIDMENTLHDPGETVAAPLNILLPDGAQVAVKGEYTMNVTIGT